MSERRPSQSSLFQGDEPPGESREPLASRMRPRRLDEILGQDHLLGEGRLLRRALETGQVPCMVLWGPPGVGKTTLAATIAEITECRFVALTAVSAGVADLRRAVEQARATPRRTILFVDEIHRFNKAQQDAVLPYVEDGTITLIGATTENPSFEVNAALLSRVRVFVLNPLGDEHVEAILRRALGDEERGLGSLPVDLAPGALRQLVDGANGDARIALNALELAVQSIRPDATGGLVVTAEAAVEALQRRALLYDASGDQHYDTISAFIKSVRGSDPDAAVYWLARMLEAGEDVNFVARRLVILASEDVGLADPHALGVAMAAQQAAHFVGLPEALFPLAEATLYLATAPKSNSVKRAYMAAAETVQRTRNDPVPLHLRNAVTGLMRHLGYGKGYRYSHDYAEDDPARWQQRYLPENVSGAAFYEPGIEGFEGTEMRRRIEEIARRSRGPGEGAAKA